MVGQEKKESGGQEEGQQETAEEYFERARKMIEDANFPLHMGLEVQRGKPPTRFFRDFGEV